MVGGNLPNLFGNAAWTYVKDEFNRKTGKYLSVPQIKSRYYIFMFSGGLSWNPDEKKLVVDDERVWDAYVKDNPDKTCYKTLRCPIYEDLSVIFGDSLATKSHAAARKNDVKTPNLTFKQGSSAFNREEEVGESSKTKSNYRGKRIPPLTSNCGFNDASTRNYVFAADLQNDPYSMPRMVKKYGVANFQRGLILVGINHLVAGNNCHLKLIKITHPYNLLT
ncbi:hypothetical protein MKW98_011812 [Papaver atlanticum]|uniref:Myb/SANT-like domain-containing protein n=1 Tax=Papaver atlanticum TaxID=357466 RepID=A0AAD4SNL4_9MAGN|nr:hypothetical protein MKW98_011812 [Papaver atlanticum]